MEVHNTRSPQQWEIISKHIDFKDKTVLDLGCGYVDILRVCLDDNAKFCLGVEKSRYIFECLTPLVHSDPYRFNVLNYDIEDFILRQDDNLDDNLFDVIICFSVLPYLKQPFTVLEWIKEHSQIALIECQYKNDGPGFGFIEDDKMMQDYLLKVGWSSVESIGQTFAEGRNKWRTIWLCQDYENI